MNFRRETGGSLGMDRQAYPIEVQATDLGNLESQAQAQGHPIAQRLTEFALASWQGLMLSPHALETGNLTPVAMVVLDDLVASHLQSHVKVLRQHRSEEHTSELQSLRHLVC